MKTFKLIVWINNKRISENEFANTISWQAIKLFKASFQSTEARCEDALNFTASIVVSVVCCISLFGCYTYLVPMFSKSLGPTNQGLWIESCIPFKMFLIYITSNGNVSKQIGSFNIHLTTPINRKPSTKIGNIESYHRARKR